MMMGFGFLVMLLFGGVLLAPLVGGAVLCCAKYPVFAHPAGSAGRRRARLWTSGSPGGRSARKNYDEIRARLKD